MRYRHSLLELVRALFCMGLPLVCLAGCQDKLLTSKWAMDDPDYAAKYSEPYGSHKHERMLKQMVDARHVAGKGGGYVTGYGSGDPDAGGLELGMFNYPTAEIETRLGLQGLIGTREKDWFLGLTPGIRLQTPTRLAPFVGIASFIGGNWETVDASHDGIDNDDDNSTDELGEDKTNFYFRGGIGPEVGVHYWLTGKSRLTLSGQHLFSTEGRKSDMWMLGITFSFLSGPEGDAASEPTATSSPLNDENSADGSVQVSSPPSER